MSYRDSREYVAAGLEARALGPSGRALVRSDLIDRAHAATLVALCPADCEPHSFKVATLAALDLRLLASIPTTDRDFTLADLAASPNDRRQA